MIKLASSQQAPIGGRGDQQFVDLAPYYDELMRVVPYPQWAEYVALLWDIHGHQARRVLDCACGTGNLTFELARLGLEVTGIDLSKPMIEQAKIKAAAPQSTLLSARNSSPVQFCEADLTDFDLGLSFDSATCLYDSLNYITEPQALARAFTCVRAHVESGGVWVFDMNSDWAFRADLFSQSNRNPQQSLNYGWKAHFDPDSRLCTVSMRFDRQRPDGTTETFYETHRERAYLLPEIEAMLKQTGWTLLGSYDAYTLNRPRDRSERWFFVARNDD
jgi:SAM-dependent methyltransferase